MDRKTVLRRITYTAILSVVFRIVMYVLRSRLESELLLRFLNFVFSVIMLLPVVPLIKVLYKSPQCRGGWWNGLKIVLAVWLAYVVIGNIVLMVTAV